MLVSKRKLFFALLTPHTLISVLYLVGLVWGGLWFPWSRLFEVIALLGAFVGYYFVLEARPPTIHSHLRDNPTRQRLVAALRPKVLRGRNYWPTPYLLNANAQTFFAAMGRPLPALELQREVVHGLLADGELCVLDWLVGTKKFSGRGGSSSLTPRGSASSPGHAKMYPTVGSSGGPSSVTVMNPFVAAVNSRAAMRPCHFSDADAVGTFGSQRRPLVIIFHGLTGGTNDVNIYYLAQFIHDGLGWDVVMPIRRGCADDHSLLTQPKHYAYGGLEDTAHVVNYVAAKANAVTSLALEVAIVVGSGVVDSDMASFRGVVGAMGSQGQRPIFALGISAGSNVMANYLAEFAGIAPIVGGLSVANGYCWDRGTQAIRDLHPVWDVIMSSLVNSTLCCRHPVFHETIGGVGGGGPVTGGPSSARGGSHGDVAAPATLLARRLAATPVTPGGGRGGGDTPFPLLSTALPNSTAAMGAPPPPLPSSSSYLPSPTSAAPPPTMLKRTSSLREYDEHVSRRIYGFESLEAFYAEQSCAPRLHKIRVPTIFLNARDDPIASATVIPYDALQQNPNLLLLTTAAGGHLGWAEGWWPFGADTPTYLDRFAMAALLALLSEAAHRRSHATMAW